jgi:PPOX class probable F420-dependent enzyme
MPAMTDDEIWTYLRSAVRAGVLSTVRPDGRPHLAPVWWQVEGDQLVFNTWSTSIKGRNIAANRAIAILVQDDQPPYTYVVVEGTASISEDPIELRRVAAELGGRYMGAETSESYGERNGVAGELLITLAPTNLHGTRDVAGD